MKKTVTIIVLVCMIFAYYVNMQRVTKQENMSNYYSLICEVVTVDNDNDTVICEDCNGNLWEFYGIENWEVGDYVNLLMYDCDTVDIYDDKIQSVY